MATQTCLRCGAPAAADATVCFTCGAPIGEVETPTQPVPIPRIPSSAESPADEPYAPAEARVGATAAVAVAPRRLSLGRGAGGAPAARRRWPLIALVAVLLVAALGGIGYVVYASLGSLSGAPVAQKSTYHDPHHRFAFTQPALWLTSAGADGVLLTDSDGTSTARITIAAPTAGEDAAAHADALATQRGGLSSAPARSFAGAAWEQRTGQVTGSDGAVRQVVVLVTLHSGTLYTIEFSSPVASFAGIDNLVYQPLAASFTFQG